MQGDIFWSVFVFSFQKVHPALLVVAWWPHPLSSSTICTSFLYQQLSYYAYYDNCWYKKEEDCASYSPLFQVLIVRVTPHIWSSAYPRSLNTERHFLYAFVFLLSDSAYALETKNRIVPNHLLCYECLLCGSPVQEWVLSFTTDHHWIVIIIIKVCKFHWGHSIQWISPTTSAPLFTRNRNLEIKGRLYKPHFLW